MVLDKLMRGVRIPVVEQQVPTNQIDDELNRALQELLPSSGIEEEDEYRAPVVGADKINARKLAAAMERSLEDQADFVDVEMELAIEQSLIQEAIRLSLQGPDAMQESLIQEAIRLSLQGPDAMQE
jgi:hypothetical protein